MRYLRKTPSRNPSKGPFLMTTIIKRQQVARKLGLKSFRKTLFLLQQQPVCVVIIGISICACIAAMSGLAHIISDSHTHKC